MLGHTALLNTRALERAQITARTADPAGGKILHEASGEPSGLLEDDAIALAQRAGPAPGADDNIKSAAAALQALAAQGVTSFLDAATGSESLAAFAALDKAGKLTARAHFAVLIKPAEARDIVAAVTHAHDLARQYDSGTLRPAPHLTVHAPAMTGAMLAPYRVNTGTREAPRWEPGRSSGPAVYSQRLCCGSC